VNSTEITTEAFERLDSIADKVMEGTQAGAEYFWPIITEQMFMEGLLTIVIGTMITVALLSVSTVIWKKCTKLSQIDNWDKGELIIGRILTVVVSALLIVIAMSMTLENGLPKILNPEFYALDWISKQLGG